MVPCLALFALSPAVLGPASGNIIPNGDFAQGNVGFTSELPYVEPTFNCLWPSGYTVASGFNHPLLHQLIAPEPFMPPKKQSGNEKAFFANAGGPERMVVWATEVKCQPKTRYLITFNSISFSGHIEDGNPPHQVATPEWVPDFEIWANDERGTPYKAGQGRYQRAKMVWYSRDKKTATVKIVRMEIPHGGGLIGITNIEMVPLPETAESTGN